MDASGDEALPESPTPIMWSRVRPTMPFDIVVARYTEDVMWTAPFTPYVVIVNKGPAPPDPLPAPAPTVVSAPNVGREGHTYYRYICDNYDHLPEHVVFVQGHPFDHSPHIVMMLRLFLAAPPSHRASLDFALLSATVLPCRLSGCDYHPNLPLADVYRTLFDHEGPQELDFYFGAGAQFVVSRRRILQRPKAFYERVVALLERTTNPIEGFVIERMHGLIFSAEDEKRGFADTSAVAAQVRACAPRPGPCVRPAVGF